MSATKHALALAEAYLEDLTAEFLDALVLAEEYAESEPEFKSKAYQELVEFLGGEDNAEAFLAEVLDAREEEA